MQDAVQIGSMSVSNMVDGKIVIFTFNLSKSFNLEDFRRAGNGEINHYSLLLDTLE